MIVGLSRTDIELKVAFEAGIGERGTRTNHWEDYAGWTLPNLFLDDEVADGTEVQHDYQALGAQAVNHLANKIVMTLFAPARPFFRLELTQEMKNALSNAGVSDSDMESLTGTVEKEAMRSMEKVRLRTSVIAATKALIVLGNTLLYFPPGGELKNSQVYNLRDYVVKRDLSGNIIQIITRDRRVCGTLDTDLREQCIAKGHKDEDKIELFTGVTLQDNGKYFVKQELGEVGIATQDADFGELTKDDLPWIPLTWNLNRGEDYGTGLVEEYAGDFSVYSQLSEAVLNLASIAADIKILVDPMGQTDVDTLNNSDSGTYVYGNAEDIAFLQLEKMQDFQFVSKIMDDYARRIGAAFLLNSQVTRQAERVTAEEIRLQANELESSLGGVYSRLAEEMQQPLAKMLIATVNTQLSKIDPVVLTGIESLSRNSEHEQMMLFLQDLTVFQTVPEGMLGEIKMREMAEILATNRGIDHTKFMKSDQEKKKEADDRLQRAEQAEQRIGGAEAANKQAAAPQSIA